MLEQLCELIDAQICLTQNRAQSAAIYLPVIWHNCLGEGRVPTHDDVAAVLSPNRKTNLLKRANNV
jgi:hypothetical protein